MSKITHRDVHGMVEHWLTTPANGYLGSDYGQDARAILFQPLEVASERSGDFLKKLRADVPVLAAMPANAVNMYGIPNPPDRLQVFIEIAGATIEVKEP